MSKTDLERFRQQEILNNQELQQRIKAASSVEEVALLSIQVGQEKGYNFTVEEVLATLKEISILNSSRLPVRQQELNDEQLEAIAGGLSKAALYTDNYAYTCGA